MDGKITYVDMFNKWHYWMTKQPYLNEPTQLILAQFNSIPISYMTCLANLFVHWTTVAPSFCIKILFSYVATWCYSHLFTAFIKVLERLLCEHEVMGSKPTRPLVMLGRASSHNCSCASFEQVLNPI